MTENVIHTQVYKAELSELDSVLAFVEDILSSYECSMKTQMQLNICIEEIFVNICHYAYENMENLGCTVDVLVHDGEVSITFTDSGMFFNPLDKEDPDINAKAEERDVGGLGIYMVKKSMDHCEYSRVDEKNIFTISKRILNV